jgi:HlyD family secretion protein
MADRTSGSRAAPAWVWAAGLALVACGPAGNGPLTGYIEGEYLRVAAPFGTLQQLTVRRGRGEGQRPLFALERERNAARRERKSDCGAERATRTCRRTSARPKSRWWRTAAAGGAARGCRLPTSTGSRNSSPRAVSSAALDDALAAKRDLPRVRLRGQHDDDEAAARNDEIRGGSRRESGARKAGAKRVAPAQRAVAAPATGLVHDTYYNAGDFVPAGSPVVSILPPANVKARFYVPEPMLAQLHAGTVVKLGCDGCGAPIPATVDFVSDLAEYTPPVLYSKENRGKLVFLVEARPAPTEAAKLKPGQPIDVTLP